MPRHRQVAPSRAHKTDYGPLKRLLLLAMLVGSSICMVSSASSSHQTTQSATATTTSATKSRNQQHQHDIDLLDPMEACYLANNRASESLTISESTPVGTVVGEIMVNGDSSSDGNIELSIKMPGGSGHPNSGGAGSSQFGFDSSRQPVGTQRQKQTTNGYYSTGNSIAAAPTATSSTSPNIARRIGPSRQNDSFASQQLTPSGGGNPSPTMAANTKTSRPKSARDLSSLIDLMPPLSIEPGSKRLILAKKLDRENLDRYIQAGGYQTSTSSGSLSQTSSASLTVHIKCQLRDRQATAEASPPLTAPLEQTPASGPANTSTNLQSPSDWTKARPPLSGRSQSSGSNSILIPVHLIVTDENDNWPTFVGSPYIIDLNESAQIGSLLQGNEIVAVDSDQQGPLSTIEYSIVAGSYWSDSFSFLNPLDSRSLVVKDNRLLDFESQPKMSLRVMASDQGDPPNWAISSLYINLLDQDDQNPVFNEDKYYGSVKENRPGEVIELGPRRMVAKDGDKNVNTPVVYSFHMKTNQSIHFDLDADLGRLSLKKSLSEESSAGGPRQPFCLLIRATQVDNPNRWTLAMVNMRMPKVSTPAGQLEDLLAMQTDHTTTAIDPLLFASSNQSFGPPAVFKFAQSSYTLELSEAAPPGSTILTVRAQWSGRDRPQDGDVTYQLLDNEMGYFRLDEQSDRLLLNRSVDYEMHRQLSVRVLATYEHYDDSRGLRLSSTRSSGANVYPRLVCDITRVNVNIVNKNEFTPEFSHEQYNFQLSVSDLIANFDQSKSLVDEETSDADKRSPDAFGAGLRSFRKRFGELESNGEEPSVSDDLGYKALQLGQVFCADRDFGDKVTLQLTGSKANLFYLTQDGRLYLPLVNVSTIPAMANQNGGATGSEPSKLASSSASSPKVINNQFMLSRLFGTRRSDQSSGSLETMDRNYLNFLLAEISQLGRLRLKVLAHDDGQPEYKQSQSLIVVTILSIDNFILQRAPQLGQPQDATGAIQLSNEASYETNHNRLESEAGEEQQQQSQARQQQVMMIPSANGKSFVQINPDIINNLLSVHSDAIHPTANGTDLASSNRPASANTSSNVMGLARSPSDSMDLAASQAVSHSVNVGEPQGAASRVQQPPSLLLVDDDGAKFVAMPAAIEVYNQQVQEAAAGQQARHRNQQAYLGDPKRKSTRQLEQTNSIWSSWRSQFGLGDTNTGGLLYWINLSTAVLLHVAVLAIIITLATRFRASFGGSSNSSRQSEESNLSNSSLWPRRFPKLGFLGSGANLTGTRTRRPNVNILDRTSTSAGQVAFMISAGGPDCSDGYNFTHQRDNSSSENNNISSYHHRRQQSISSGVVVSAISKGYKAREMSSTSVGTHMSTGVSSAHLKHQNLFDHLKLTINRMLDIRDDKTNGIQGQVTIKPLDTESELFTSCARSYIAEGNQDPTTSAHDQATPSSVVGPTQVDSTGKSTSTFVGNSSPQKHRRITKTLVKDDRMTASQSANEASDRTVTNATVVSINVKAPPSKLTVDTDPDGGFKGGGLLKGSKNQTSVNSGCSSSSSAVSLVSMSSSISNKISAAVQRSSSNTQTQTNSDTSSIDSTTLFNTNGSCPPSRQPEPILASNQATSASMPPVPPPLPPPPSLVQVISCPNLSPMQSRKLCSLSAALVQSQLVNRRREVPQNPVHVKLRQQAMSEQVVGISRSASRTDPPKSSPSGRASSGRLNQQETRPPTSTGGRREARAQANEHRNLPPTPPPLPPNGIITGSPMTTTSTSTSTKTVSPTTSVDRGYESFQSYSSSSQQPLRYRQSNQFSSLQEYDLVNSQPGHEPPNQPKHPPVSSFSAESSANNLARAGNKSKLNVESSSSDCRFTTSKRATTGGYECDTEDDDFYYCNNGLEPANLADVDVNYQQMNPATGIGILLSDYASHTYRPSNGANKAATTALTTACKEARSTNQSQQQSISKQQQHKARTFSSNQPQQQLHSTRVLVQGRNACNYQHIINTSNRITNDLISSSSASCSSSPTTTISPAVNNNSSGSHQRQQHQLAQQHELYHQSSCDILAQVNYTSTYQNYPLSSSITPSNHQLHRKNIHHLHPNNNRNHSLGCNNHHRQQKEQQYLQQSQPNQNQHQSLPPNHGNNTGGKKQLTWSDQVEMAA